MSTKDLSKPVVGDFVEFFEPNPDTAGVQTCYGEVVSVGNIKVTVKTITDYGVPQKLTRHMAAFKVINAEDII